MVSQNKDALSEFLHRDVTLTTDGGRAVIRGELIELGSEYLRIRRHNGSLVALVARRAISSIADDGSPQVRRRAVEEREAVEVEP